MSVFNTFYSWYLRKRSDQVAAMMKDPHPGQHALFHHLVDEAKNTDWGQLHGYRSIQNIEQFKSRVPISNYEKISPWIERMMKGEQNILWPGEIKWFAKSSGTTNDKSKYIPVSYESVEDCHLKAARDLLSIYCSQVPDTRVFSGKGLVMGGSHQVNNMGDNSFYGDLSAVLMMNLPFWVHFIRTPDLSVALLSDWEDKIEKMARATIKDDVTNISGVPTWTLVLAEKIFELTGKSDLTDVWPNLELYVHGGVSFTPYRNRFKELTAKRPINFMETYNASEGFFGLQNDLTKNDLLLMTDYGIFYEFMPMEYYGTDHPKTHLLHEVELNKEYALIISTNSGLWRYLVGDTIRFTSTKPYKFTITGRTRHYINAFGEELMIDNADRAIAFASQHTEAAVRDYTAAPIYFEGTEKPTHQWLIEFEKEPNDYNKFCKLLDENLQSLNSDYEAKRYKNMAMQMPKVQMLANGTFHSWLKSKGKLGGQHKVPRLCNDRSIIEEVLQTVEVMG